MNQSIYVKIDYGKAISAKKQVLSSEADVLHIIKHMNEYKKLRNQELILKTRLKNQLKFVKLSLKKAVSEMPQIPNMEIKAISRKSSLPIQKPATVREKRKNDSIEKELAEIHEKLNRLEK
jgi:hypothetical protein